MNEKLEKLNRQKTAAEKKLIAAQHREKEILHRVSAGQFSGRIAGRTLGACSTARKRGDET